MFKRIGGVKGFLNNVKKTALLVKEGFPYENKINVVFSNGLSKIPLNAHCTRRNCLAQPANDFNL